MRFLQACFVAMVTCLFATISPGADEYLRGNQHNDTYQYQGVDRPAIGHADRLPNLRRNWQMNEVLYNASAYGAYPGGAEKIGIGAAASVYSEWSVGWLDSWMRRFNYFRYDTLINKPTSDAFYVYKKMYKQSGEWHPTKNFAVVARGTSTDAQADRNEADSASGLPGTIGYGTKAIDVVKACAKTVPGTVTTSLLGSLQVWPLLETMAKNSAVCTWMGQMLWDLKDADEILLYGHSRAAYVTAFMLYYGATVTPYTPAGARPAVYKPKSIYVELFNSPNFLESGIVDNFLKHAETAANDFKFFFVNTMNAGIQQIMPNDVAFSAGQYPDRVSEARSLIYGRPPTQSYWARLRKMVMLDDGNRKLYRPNTIWTRNGNSETIGTALANFSKRMRKWVPQHSAMGLWAGHIGADLASAYYIWGKEKTMEAAKAVCEGLRKEQGGAVRWETGRGLSSGIWLKEYSRTQDTETAHMAAIYLSYFTAGFFASAIQDPDTDSTVRLKYDEIPGLSKIYFEVLRSNFFGNDMVVPTADCAAFDHNVVRPCAIVKQADLPAKWRRAECNASELPRATR